MPVVKTVVSPHRFKERILGFGEGGAGKTEAILNMARYMPYAQFWVHDTDVSFAYDRGLALGYNDVDERGQVHVLQSSEWSEFVENNAKIKADSDPVNDVLVVDDGTQPWAWVQDAFIQDMYGIEVEVLLANLRKQFINDDKAYFAAVADTMHWPMVNKKFNKGFYHMFHGWKGHAVIMARSKSTKGEKDEDLLTQFKVHGAMPAGQKDLPFVMRTNVLFMTRPKNTWAFSTTKDQGRAKVEKVPLTEFAFDYLVDHAGWTVDRQRV